MCACVYMDVRVELNHGRAPAAGFSRLPPFWFALARSVFGRIMYIPAAKSAQAATMVMVPVVPSGSSSVPAGRRRGGGAAAMPVEGGSGGGGGAVTARRHPGEPKRRSEMVSMKVNTKTTHPRPRLHTVGAFAIGARVLRVLELETNGTKRQDDDGGKHGGGGGF